MHAKRFRTLFRLSIPVCLLVGLVLTAPGVTVRSAPAGAPERAPVAQPFVVTITTDEFGGGIGCSLREAIQSVNTNAEFGGCTGSGDIITLPAGTYTLTGAANEDNNASGDLDIKGNLIINGADEKTTFIQAGTNATNGVDRVMHIFDGYAVEINDVTIRYGKAPDGIDGADDATCTGSHGGGIYSDSDTTLILNDCVVAYNRTGDGGAGCTSASSSDGRGGYGGGIYVNGGTLTLDDTSVKNNESGAGGDGGPGGDARYGGFGGGIFLYNSEATLTDSWISSNVTGDGGHGVDVASGTAGDGGSGGYGGGIHISYLSALTLTESIVAGNGTGAGGDGGDSFSGDGGDGGDSGNGAGINNITTLVVIESAIYDNAVGLGGHGGSGTGAGGDDGYRGDGGGISNTEIATLSKSTIRDNVAWYGGGIDTTGSGTVMTLDGCTVSANTAAGSGGGIYNDSGATVALTNSTFSGNDANTSGGGIYNSSGAAATLTHVTITDNTADVDNDGSGDGGGIAAFGAFTMTNTIVAVNYDKGGERPDCWGTVASGDYNLLGIGDSAGCTFASQPHDQVGTAASPLNPLLALNLEDNGGPTLTHALKPSSPAVDQIPAGVNGCVMGARDQRGVLRFPPCDIGAYEIGPESVYLPLVVKD